MMCVKWNCFSLYFVIEIVSEENPGKAWKELNRLLGSKKGRGIEVVKTEGGVLTEERNSIGFFISGWSGGWRQY